ncbi:LicD family-domain-containing protein [Annulohypoxylon maeteangense]|uniref:LicD family-domain-containing protein n=1 Tax=Annulohypoxylon maeteangense TaxID=1927788 RepID=UPI0020087CAF|nr:LicD family-domain-containing protein [Annulohypoxylon maeteangense]KAI0884652.1 LicD family-domain-containing protein [Annulohypoxylon maeteangense]
MHLTILFLALIVAVTATALPNQPQDTSSSSNSSESDEKREEHKKPQQRKYFKEAGATMELGHYDKRYFKSQVPYAEHRPALRHLVRSWLTTSRELGVETWLAHGTLLGWWWGGRVMPWDYDLDVQMPTTTLSYLGRYFNQTLHDYAFNAWKEGEDGPEWINKTYLLDVNPHAGDIDRGNGANIIDARWIDTSNGLYIDITGLAERDPAGAPGIWSCKNSHKYRIGELYPIRRTEFEGVPARVPYAFDKILTDEYGGKSLTNTEWLGHHWVPELKQWVKNPDPPPEEKGQATLKKPPKPNNNAVVVVVEKTVVKGTS